MEPENTDALQTPQLPPVTPPLSEKTVFWRSSSFWTNFIGTAAAVGLVWLGILSLRNGWFSNQPYLTVVGGKMSLVYSGPVFPQPPLSAEQVKKYGNAPKAFYVRYEFDIENKGNTEAIGKDIVVKITVPKGWNWLSAYNDAKEEKQGVFTVTLSNIGTVAPKTHIMRGGEQNVIVVSEKLSNALAGSLAGSEPEIKTNGPLVLIASMTFADAIGNTKHLDWCWTSDVVPVRSVACPPTQSGATVSTR